MAGEQRAHQVWHEQPSGQFDCCGGQDRADLFRRGAHARQSAASRRVTDARRRQGPQGDLVRAELRAAQAERVTLRRVLQRRLLHRALQVPSQQCREADFVLLDCKIDFQVTN